MNISLVQKSAKKLQTDLLVAFAITKKGKKDSEVIITHDELHTSFKKSIASKEITGKSGEAVLFRATNFFDEVHNIVIVGLGDESEITPEILRQAGAAAQSQFKTSKASSISVDFDGVPSKNSNTQYVQAFVEGLLLGAYAVDHFKTKSGKEKTEAVSIYLTALKKEHTEALKTAITLAETVNFARRLGDSPGNLMTPTILANEAVAAAKGTGIKATIWNKARIKKEKMGGLLGVAQGSDQEPRFIILEYYGAAKSKKPLVFVGKGLTFDCGGISIKPSAGMEEMKYDMCGGANVIATLIAIAKLKLKVNAIALVPSTENLINGSATKPGDIHTARNGKTFEINNTDAEGRLILSDALCYATEQKPEIIIDAATLTGAMVVALGNIHTGFFTRNKDLKNKIDKAAESTGELVWQMPLVDHHVADMKGTYADLSNMSSGKGAGSATAAAFLEQFVDSKIPWAHFDIAGTGWSAGNRLNYCPKKGASGVMVRTFVELAKQYENL